MDDLSSRLASLSPEKRALLQKMLAKPLSTAAAIPRRPPGMPPGLSFAQQRLWFLDQLEGPSATYNMPSAFRIRGRLDVPALEQTFRDIIERHEVLRTNISQVAGRPEAVAREGADGYLSFVDLSPLSAAQQDEEVQRRSHDCATHPFDLARDRLMRVEILRCNPESHVLLIAMHHSVSDGWSLGVLVREMLALYTARLAGQPNPLPPLPIQYGDFARWQREWLSGDEIVPQLQFWRDHLQGAPPLLALPTDRARPAVQSFRGRTLAFTIAAERLQAVKALARSRDASLFMVLLAAFGAVLRRYSGQSDFVVGTPVANRLRKELEPLVGFFVNTLALRLDTSGDPTAADLIGRVKSLSLDAFRHQDVPFERLVEELQPARQLGFSPIFQVMFILQNAPLGAVRLPGLDFEEMELQTGTSMFDLTLKLRERGGVIEGECEFNTDLFDLATIERFAAHFDAMLEGMTAEPSRPVSRVALLGSAEQHQMLSEWNATTHPVTPATVVDLFEAQVARDGARVAVEYGGERLTYAEVKRRADCLAGYLQSQGVSRETPIGLCVPRSFETLIGLLGILKAGGAYVPLDPAFPSERLALMIDSARVPIILTTAATESLLPPSDARRVRLDQDWHLVEQAPPIVRVPVAPEQLAYVIYTSGSTGTPKGVQIPHGALTNFLESMRRAPGLDRDDVLLAVTTISFDIAALELYLPLTVGARVVIVPQEVAADGFTLLGALRACGANVMQATPATWQMLLAAGWQGAPLRRCFCGGEALSRDLAAKLLATGVELWNLYGPTETAIWSAASRVEADPTGRAAADAKELIGRPIANTQIYILDPNLQPVPVGVAGELYIAGDGLARGYARRPELTAAAFVPHPFGMPGSRMYRTGDVCRYRPDGRIEFLGRIDHQIKLRGFRIELGEIEAVIDEHPAVRHSVVVCREDRPGQQQLVAYIQRDAAVAVASDTGAIAEGQVDKWRAVWDGIYHRSDDRADDTFDTSGWISSYTGERIPDADMRAWLDETVARILALRPARVMEIGCGTGMILHRVAPHVAHYTGIDASNAVVERVRASVDRRGLRHVTVRRGQADIVDPADLGQFDVVVLNSVVQYFPGADYLVRVIAAAASAIRDGGAIFLGDVRSLPQGRLFRTSVEFFQAPDACTADELRRRIAASVEREEELLLAPAFWSALRGVVPRLSGVELDVKRHDAATEMSRFRYDVVLRIGPPDAAPAPAVTRHQATGADFDRGRLDALLSGSAATILVEGMANARVAGDLLVQHWLADRAAAGVVGDWRARVHEAGGINPADIWTVGEAQGYDVSVRPSPAEPDRRIDALFHRVGDGQTAAAIHAHLQGATPAGPFTEWANDPVRAAADRVVIAEVRQTLASRLPTYMQPSSVMCLDRLPLTPNGKVNRAALPAPEVVVDDDRYVPPATALEQQLAEIWGQILDVPRVGVGDSFFELGGHSLLAMQLISRIREQCAVELPIQALFDTPRLGDLAAQIAAAGDASRPTLPPIRPLDRGIMSELPLSFAQQRLWFLDRLEGASTTYNLFGAVRFDGELSVAALEQAFGDVIQRHEALRCHIVERDGRPVAVVSPLDRCAIELVDLSALDEVSQQRELDRRMEVEVGRPFNLATDLLLRAVLIRLSPQRHVLALSVHHIVSDEWSMGVLIGELSALYAAAERGAAAVLPSLPVQYADYAAWQRSWLDEAVIRQQREFWREQLSGAPALLELPTDRPRARLQRHRGRIHAFHLDASVADALDALGQQTDTTLFMTLLAGYAILLQRYSGQSDIVIGSPIANRVRPELETLIGFFVNTLPFRINLDGSPTVRELLARVRRSALAAYANQDVPFEQLVDELRPERNLGHAPIFQVMLVLQNAPAPDLRQTSLTITPVEPHAVAAKFDLTFSVERTDRGLSAVIEYDTDLFDGATIERMARHFGHVLGAMALDPARIIDDVPLIDGAERHRLIDEFNTTLPLAPAHDTVIGLFERQAERHGEDIAVRAGDACIRYRELNERAGQVAATLTRVGIGPDVLVGIYLPRGIDAIASMLGVLKAGGGYVPLDLQSPEERLRHMITDTAMAVIVTSRALAPALEQLNVPLLMIEDIGPGAPILPRAVSPHTLAYVIYTSGSTGRPKGVAVSHDNCSRAIAARRAYYCDEPMTALFSPLSFAFDAGNGAVFWALCEGACLVLGPDDATQPHEMLSRIAAHECTHVISGPALYGSLLDLASVDQLSSLRTVALGGEVLSPSIVAKHAELVPQAWLHNEYGPTEATVWSSVSRVVRDEPPTIGTAVPGCRLYVLDRRLTPAPIGVVGELFIGGGQVARGYLGYPEVTAERFIPDPFGPDPGGRLYRTGDLVKRRAGGALEFVGRADGQVKIRGFRVELGEVETAMLQHPAVRAAVVVVHVDPGTAQKRLVAYHVPVPDAAVDATDLQSFLKTRMPAHMVPSAFVELHELPLTANGKVDRRALPAPDASHSSGAYVAARTPTEQLLAGIWQEVLGIERIGVHDNFFELGGDSILSIQIISRVNRAGLGLTVRQLFEWQTIAELARVAPERTTIHAEQGLVTGPVPLTPIQHWFFEGRSPQPHHQNQAVLLEAAAALDANVVRATVASLLWHHDALRLRFDLTTEPPVARLSDAVADVPFTVCDFSAMPAAAAARAVTADADQAQRTLDLANGPLVRAVLYRMPAGTADRLLLIVHHLAVDGVSWRVLIEDFVSAYSQLAHGQAAELPAKTTSIRHWAERLQAYATTADVSDERMYWRDVLTQPVGVLPRRVNATDAQNTAASAEHVTVRVSPAISHALLTRLPAAYRTHINDALLCALTRSVARWTGNARTRIVLEGHGREEVFDDVDLSRTVGVFTSFYPVVLTSDRNEPVSATVMRVKEALRAVPHRGLRFGLLRYLNDAAEIPKGPAAEISFNYLGRFDGDPRLTIFRGVAPESVGATSTEQGMRRYVLDINGIQNVSSLEFTWTFSRHLHDRVEIERVANDFVRELELLAEHCQDPAVGGYTASDFPLASPPQVLLAELFDRWGRRVEDAYPLAPMQQGMVFHSLVDAHGGVDIIQLSCLLEGEVRADLFRRAWQQVVDRHAALRTAYLAAYGGDPVQVVIDRVDLPWVDLDWRSMAASQQRDGLAQWLRDDRQRGFAIDQPPLMRCALIQLGPARSQFIWSHHHLLTDGWCLPILLNEAMAIYQGLVDGQPAALPAPRPFAEYIRWLSRQDSRAGAAFWKAALEGFSSPTRLGIDRGPGVADGGRRFETASVELSTVVTDALQQLAQSRRVTLSVVVQTAWAVALARYAGANDVVFGSTVSGRPPDLPGVDGMIGLFINTLPVRVTIDESQSIAALMTRVQDQQVQRDAFAYVSLVDIQKQSEVAPPEPLFDSIVVFENYPMDESLGQAGGPFAVRAFELFEQTNLPITLMTAPAERLPLRMAYDAARFDGGDIRRLLTHLERLLEGVAANPDCAIGNWPMLPDAEIWGARVGNDTAADLGHFDARLSQLFEAQAARTPSKTAVVAGHQSATYDELNRYANRLAHQFMARGIGPGSRVAICLDRSIGMLASLLAVNKAGAAYVPMDPSFPADRLAHMLHDSNAAAIVTRPALVADSLTSATMLIDVEAMAVSRDDDVHVVAHPNSAAYVIYTSGSTGTPKGVEVSNGALVNLLRSMQRTPGLHERDVLLAVTTISFDIAALELFLPLITGATVVMADRDAARDGAALLQEMRRTSATVMQATPVTWRLLLDAGWNGAPLVRALCGGEALPSELSARLLQTGVDLWNVYGPTETTIWSAAYRVAHASADALEPIGRPIHNTRFYVVDRAMRLVPAGVPGELLIGGDGVALGYAGRGDLTAERFVPDPFSGNSGARVYRTGDLVRQQPDRSLVFIGRLDSQVKVRGFRIELGEIEAALDRVPAVRQSVVIVHTPAHGEHELVAYVVAAGDAVDVEILRALLGQTLPAYMVPAHIVVLPELPLTLNGKVNRRALPAPDGQRPAAGVAPQTSTEVAMAAIWAEVFNLSAVGIDDSFFELGGHSLLAAKVTGRVRTALGVSVPIPLLFKEPTIRRLAEYVDNTLWAAGKGASASAADGDVEEVSL